MMQSHDYLIQTNAERRLEELRQAATQRRLAELAREYGRSIQQIESRRRPEGLLTKLIGRPLFGRGPRVAALESR